MAKKVAKCMMGWLILGKTALIYSVVTIFAKKIIQFQLIGCVIYLSFEFEYSNQ